MKLTKDVYEVMNNFAKINGSMIVSGNDLECLKTMNDAENIIGVYDLKTPFPREFAIYDLPIFLGVIDLLGVEKVELDFSKDGFVLMKSGNQKVKYYYTEPSLIKGYSKFEHSSKYKNFDKWHCSFDLTHEQLKNVRKASNILLNKDHQFIQMFGKDGKVKILLDDSDYGVSSNYTLMIDDPEKCEDARIKVNISGMDLIKGNYNIKFHNKKMIRFTHKDAPLVYFFTASS